MKHFLLGGLLGFIVLLLMPFIGHAVTWEWHLVDRWLQ